MSTHELHNRIVITYLYLCLELLVDINRSVQDNDPDVDESNKLEKCRPCLGDALMPTALDAGGCLCILKSHEGTKER